MHETPLDLSPGRPMSPGRDRRCPIAESAKRVTRLCGTAANAEHAVSRENRIQVSVRGGVGR